MRSELNQVKRKQDSRHAACSVTFLDVIPDFFFPFHSGVFVSCGKKEMCAVFSWPHVTVALLKKMNV